MSYPRYSIHLPKEKEENAVKYYALCISLTFVFAFQTDDPASVLGAADLNGFTALIVSAQNGHSDIADWLLGDLKVDPNACTKVSSCTL